LFRYIGYLKNDGDNGNLGGFHMEGVLGGGGNVNGAYLKADLTNRNSPSGYKYSQITGGTIGSDMNVFMVSNTSSTNIDLYIQYGNSAWNGFNLDIKSFWSTFTFVNIEGTADPRTAPTSYTTYWDLITSANFVQKGSNGNVGIGATNPGRALECSSNVGTAQTPLRLSNYNPAAGSKSTILEFSGTDSGAGLKQVGLITAGGYNSDYTTGSFLSFSALSSPFLTSTTPTEYMRISSATAAGQSFIGIGTTAAAAGSNVIIWANVNLTNTTGSFPLVIAADTTIKIRNNGNSLFAGDPGQGQLILCGTTNTNQRLAFMYDTVNDIGLIQAMINTTGPQKLCLNAAGGNVGIGTTNPTSNLHVYSTAPGTTITLTDVSGGNTDTSIFQNLGGALTIKSQTNTTNPSGGVSLASGATAWSPVSDSRLKNIISHISGALANVSILNPIIYSLIGDPENIPHPGFIAQDVLKVQPEAVSMDKDGFYGVRYTELIPMAFAAIKELSAENTFLKTQMISLEARIAALESK
jgi:hypothetical protein